VQLFNLEKNGQHNYEEIKTILSTLKKNSTDEETLYAVSETSAYNDRLYEMHGLLEHDIDEDEKLYHGFCYRIRLLQIIIMKRKAI
jgi:hypothetical protein